jgi:hypothetical protein
VQDRRRGSFIIEAMMACLLLGVAISMLVPGLQSVGRQRKMMTFENLATIVLNNTARFPDRVASQLTDSEFTTPVPLALPDWFAERYRDATFSAAVLPPQDSAADTTAGLQAVRLTISGTGLTGMTPPRVSLVIWIETAPNADSGAVP